MIDVKNISYSFGGKKSKNILNDISFSVGPSECVGVLGNNGAGKSTIINCIAGIYTPTSGSIYIDEQNIKKAKLAKKAKLIAYVPQKNDISQMTVFDTVLLGRKPYIKLAIAKEDYDICNHIIKEVGIDKLKLKYVNELSGGEQQKVMLARALVQNPKLLLLDEPTSNLDPKNQYEMLALVKNIAIKTDTSVIMVLHDINLALRYCHRFLFLKSGEIYKYGDESIVTEETIYGVYQVNSLVTYINGKKNVVIEGN